MNKTAEDKNAGDTLLRLGLPEPIWAGLFVTLTNHDFNLKNIGLPGAVNPWDVLTFNVQLELNNPEHTQWEFGVNGKTHPLKLTACPNTRPLREIEKLYVPDAMEGFLKPMEGAVSPLALVGMLASAWGGEPDTQYDAGIFITVGILTQLSRDPCVKSLQHGYDLTSKQYVVCLETEAQFWVWSVSFTEILLVAKTLH
jgi:hypothetical protein